MHTLVIFESMYGNTHAIATAIAGSLSRSSEVRIVPVSEATDELLAWADLVVAGAPTHAHGMPTAKSRSSAVDSAAKPDGWSQVTLDPSAQGPGIREWLEGLGAVDGKRAAAFDTRAPDRRCSRVGHRPGSPSSCVNMGSRSWPTPRASSSTRTSGSGTARKNVPRPGPRASCQSS